MNYKEKKCLLESYFNQFLDYFLNDLKTYSNSVYLKKQNTFLFDKNNFQTLFKRNFFSNDVKKIKEFLNKKKEQNNEFLKDEIFIQFTKDNEIFKNYFHFFSKDIRIHFYLCYFINKKYEMNIFSPSLTIDYDI